MILKDYVTAAERLADVREERHYDHVHLEIERQTAMLYLEHRGNYLVPKNTAQVCPAQIVLGRTGCAIVRVL